MKKLYALTMLFSMASLQASDTLSDPLCALVPAIKEKNLVKVTAAIEKVKTAGVLNRPYDWGGSTALHFAVETFPSAVPLLIKAGSNVHAKDIYGSTPLHCTQDPAAIRALVVAGASVNAPADYGLTPLHYAVSERHLDVVTLLAPLSDLERRCSSGHTALHKAANCRRDAPCQTQEPIVRILLGAGADIHARVLQAENSIESELGNTPLHCAAQSGNTDIVRLLIARGADISDRTLAGNTPLHCAAQSGNTDVVRLLLRCTGTRNPCKQTQAPEEEEKQ